MKERERERERARAKERAKEQLNKITIKRMRAR